MIKKLIIGFILIICISSTAFSVMSYYSHTNNSDMNNSGSISIIGNTNGNINPVENSLIKYIDYIDDTLQNNYGYVVNVNGELRHYITETAYYLESEGLTDKYIRCSECGGFLPVGDITNPLPKEAICHCNSINNISGYKNFTYSRDEAYLDWIEYKKVTQECEHLEEQGDIMHISAIYCKDCDGFVSLNNYNFNLDKTNSYLKNIINIVDLSFLTTDLGSNIIQCSHYNGTLDLHNVHIEDFHPGWFRSMDEYNSWLKDAGKSLNENNNIEDSVTSADNETYVDEVVYPDDNESYDDFNQDSDNDETFDNSVQNNQDHIGIIIDMNMLHG